MLLVKDLFNSEEYAVKSIDKKYLLKYDYGFTIFQDEIEILKIL